jgi:hypothetical protein
LGVPDFRLNEPTRLGRVSWLHIGFPIYVNGARNYFDYNFSGKELCESLPLHRVIMGIGNGGQYVSGYHDQPEVRQQKVVKAKLQASYNLLNFPHVQDKKVELVGKMHWAQLINRALQEQYIGNDPLAGIGPTAKALEELRQRYPWEPHSRT